MVPQLDHIPGLRHRLNTTRARLWRLAVVRHFGVVGLLLAGGFAFALLGGFSLLPSAIAGYLIFGFWAAFFYFVYRGLKTYSGPTDAEAIAAFDAQSEWRPIASLTDRPSRPDRPGQTLWSEHRQRLKSHVNTLRPPSFAADWKARDPIFLRFAVPAVLLGLIGFTGTDSASRLGELARPNIAAMLGAEQIQVEAWVTPPEYAARAPIFLKTDVEQYETPINSDVTLRADAPSPPRLVIKGDRKRRSRRFKKTPDGAYEITITLEESASIDVRWWGRQAGWRLETEPDAVPLIAFDEPPVLEGKGLTKFIWTGSDDYGLETVNLVLKLATPHPASPDDTARISLDLPGVSVESVEKETTELDLTRHYWAGALVTAQLEAVDGAGQRALTKPVELKLPEKLFLRPLARAVQEVRVAVLAEPRGYPGEPIRGIPEPEKDPEDEGPEFAPWISELEYAPEGIQHASLMLDALTYKPERFFSDYSLYLGLRTSFSLITTARSKEKADSSDDLLWAMALKAEYGSAADALAALQAARKALERALREGASEEEIARLTEAFRQAAENYIQARMAEALANGLDAPPEAGQDGAGGGGGGGGFGQGSFEDMLNTLSELTETGATDQARQLLADISNLLENLEFQQGGQGSGDGFALPNQGDSEDGEDGEQSEAEQNLSDALEDLSENLRDQRELNDDTIESNRRGDQSDTGGELDPESLAERQEGIAEALERLLQREEDRANQGGTGEEDKQGEGAGILSDEALERLGQAQRDQQAAEDALEGGATGLARRYQERATRLLNEAIESVSDQLDALAEEDGDPRNADRQQTDPFGRELEEGTRGFGTGEVDLSGEEQRRRAQEVLEELRRRYGEAIDEEEREYLRRLLDRF